MAFAVQQRERFFICPKHQQKALKYLIYPAIHAMREKPDGKLLSILRQKSETF